MLINAHHHLIRIREALRRAGSGRTARVVLPWLLMLVILALQNGLYFWRHFSANGIFPNDFLLTYQAVPYYLVEVARVGKDTSWIPFQGMGYPTYMNLQSGFDYLPIRLLSWLGVAYSFEVAKLLQIAHVYLGAVGAAVCARTCGMKWWQAILAGVFYQGFGGFYSNAQHPDIIRSFAFLPWLCMPVFMNWRAMSRLNWIAIVLLPLWIFMQWTGAYPGATLAVFFVLGSVTLVRTLLEKEVGTVGLLIGSAMLVGTLLSGLTLLPAFLDAREIARSVEVGSMQYDYLVTSDMLSLIFPITNDRLLHHDQSMRSVFVGIPAITLFLLGLLRWRPMMKWPVVSMVLAILIASGLLHPLLARLIPPLGVSRFVMADYRGIIGLAIVLVACAALQDTRAQARRMLPLLPVALLLIGGTYFFDELAIADWTLWHMEYVVQAICAIAAISLLMLVRCIPSWPGQWMFVSGLVAVGALFLLALNYLFGVVLLSTRSLLLLVIALLILAPLSARIRVFLPHLAGLGLLLLGARYVWYLYTVPAHGQLPVLVALSLPFGLAAVALWLLPGPGRWLLPVLMAAASVFNWSGVHWDQRYFLAHPNDGVPWVEAHAGKFSETRSQLMAALRSEQCRTARREVSHNEEVFPWNGYYTGQYFMRDYSGPLKLARHVAILKSDVSRNFAQKEWTMMALPGRPSSQAGTLDLSSAVRVDATCIKSGTSSEEFHFSLAEPALVVENEIFWDGWAATLQCIDCQSADKPIQLTALEAGGFRAWQLPAGNYRMEEQFTAPHLWPARIMTLIGVSLLLLLWAFLKRRMAASERLIHRAPD
ncbi:hypothetical protein [Herbaspirillum frisingense]|nr:hypothetical protein [Herbaspirillum frisingense]